MNIKKRQEVINLMPWYNLGKLSSAEKSMVDEALNEDPSLREQLILDQKIMSEVIADPKLLDRSAFESSTVRLDNVLAQIDGAVVTKIASSTDTVTEQKKQTVNVFAGIKSFFTDLLAGSSHSFTYAVFAALTVVQLALLMFFVVPATVSSTFNTASDGESTLTQPPAMLADEDKNATGLVLLVAMKDNIKIEGFTSTQFGDLKFEILPDDYGYYRLRLNKKLTPKELEVLKDDLSHKTGNAVSVLGELESQ